MHDDQGRYDWHLCKVVRVNNRAEMRVSVEYYDGEPREALKLHEEEWGIISCPEKRTAPSRDETLFADVLNISIENATKMSKDRKLWSSNRPSLRCQPQ